MNVVTAASITSVIALDDRASLAAHAVDRRLADDVRCYWSLTVSEPPARIRVVPDGQVDLVFDLDSGEAHLGGTREEPMEVVHERATRLLGVTLLPGAAAAFFGVPVSALSADWQPLSSVIGAVAEQLASRLCESESSTARLALLEAFLLARLERVEPPDARVRRALREIDDSDGRIDMARLGRESGASPRNLSRLFQAWVGMSPKRFARIVRVQAALRRLAEPAPPTLAALAAEIGFADQAHLAREIRAVAGAPPSELAETFKHSADPFKL
jgi:AraC-like DNA-binding protein